MAGRPSSGFLLVHQQQRTCCSESLPAGIVAQFDAHFNMTSYTRCIQVVTVTEEELRSQTVSDEYEHKGPVISLIGRNPIEVRFSADSDSISESFLQVAVPVVAENSAPERTIYTDPGATCLDSDGHKLTPVLTFPLRDMTPGTHAVSYTCFDDNGVGAIKDREVIVQRGAYNLQRTAGKIWGKSPSHSTTVNQDQTPRVDGSLRFPTKVIILLLMVGVALGSLALKRFDPDMEVNA